MVPALMDPQVLSTTLAWAMVILTALVALIVVRQRSHIHWSASAAFAVAALLLAVAAALSATSVLVRGPAIGEEARWIIIVCRALATVLFLGTAMDLTGRPRWIGRILGHHDREGAPRS